MIDYQLFYIFSISLYIIVIIILLFREIKIKNIYLYSFFYFYITSILAITVFPIPIQWLEEIWKYVKERNNYTPFLSIFDILLNENLSIFIKIKQIVWNIAIFVPMWFFIPIICENKNYFKKVLLIGIWFSFFIELVQYIVSFLLWFNYRITDIDDILLNTLWLAIGFILYKLFYKVIKQQQKNS